MVLASEPARIDRPIGSMYGKRMTWRRLENQSAATKMAAARNASAGAVLPVNAGTRNGMAAMAVPSTTLTTLRRWLADGVTAGAASGGCGAAPGSTGTMSVAR